MTADQTTTPTEDLAAIRTRLHTVSNALLIVEEVGKGPVNLPKVAATIDEIVTDLFALEERVAGLVH